MNSHRESALFSAASYLCSAAEDLRRAGYVALADEVLALLAYLDAEVDAPAGEPIAALLLGDDGQR